jgi:hypothetical protein
VRCLGRAGTATRAGTVVVLAVVSFIGYRLLQQALTTGRFARP